jgi:DNA-binding NarL/FixJ family response regulator
MLIAMATPDSILIVDDHALVRDGMRTLLQGCFAQCNILEAGNYAEAREALAQNAEVDLVLLDLNIPDAKRFSALQGLREEHPAVPVVMVSGTLDGSAVREALAGAAGFIPKSLKRDQIVEALRQVWPVKSMSLISILSKKPAAARKPPFASGSQP